MASCLITIRGRQREKLWAALLHFEGSCQEGSPISVDPSCAHKPQPPSVAPYLNPRPPHLTTSVKATGWCSEFLITIHRKGHESKLNKEDSSWYLKYRGQCELVTAGDHVQHFWEESASVKKWSKRWREIMCHVIESLDSAKPLDYPQLFSYRNQ
jgi:hypothetical protein